MNIFSVEVSGLIKVKKWILGDEKTKKIAMI